MFKLCAIIFSSANLKLKKKICLDEREDPDEIQLPSFEWTSMRNDESHYQHDANTNTGESLLPKLIIFLEKALYI